VLGSIVMSEGNREGLGELDYLTPELSWPDRT
jgi:hypothetical protein